MTVMLEGRAYKEPDQYKKVVRVLYVTEKILFSLEDTTTSTHNNMHEEIHSCKVKWPPAMACCRA